MISKEVVGWIPLIYVAVIGVASVIGFISNRLLSKRDASRKDVP